MKTKKTYLLRWTADTLGQVGNIEGTFHSYEEIEKHVDALNEERKLFYDTLEDFVPLTIEDDFTVERI